MITTYKRKDFKNFTPYSYSLLHNQSSKTYYNNHNNTYIYPDYVTINCLDIADGLKELLIKYGFTLDELSSMSSSELAEFLGIDQCIAKIIGSAAIKLSNDSYTRYNAASGKLQTGNCVS
jgi:hypothetical protein